jgi:predicted nuclease of restriction endonuclease-like (RecB) superfamily
MNNALNKTTEYRDWLKDLKLRVRQAQLKAAVQVNSALLVFYWELGADIVERQKTAKWGSGFLKQLSADLMAEFPDMKGFSYRNIRAIRQWYPFYSIGVSNLATGCGQIAAQPAPQLDADNPIWSQPVAKLVQIPWGHNREIISKCANTEEALYYVNKTIENNWSRSVLVHQIESGLFQREGQSITNFSETLPAPQSDLAQQLLKDPYTFDFLSLTEDYNEREFETALTEHITKFLLELGAGFAFVGRQKALQVGDRDFFIDLLFYHTKLHCYVVVELKMDEFEPEYAGKLNFYLKAVDEQLRGERDDATIGILLCKSRDRVVVEYALSDIHKPIGVSKYELTRSLPDDLKPSLPSIEELEAELADREEETE